MAKKVSEEQIRREISGCYKPPTLESGITKLPFTDLSDRDFELLTYLLVKGEIERGTERKFNAVALMQGVGERGRDCVLYTDNVVTGLLQCKKITGRVSRPSTIKEIIKFLLYTVIDASLMPDPENFEYRFYVADDLSEPTLDLFHTHPISIEKEFGNGDFINYILAVISEYESFAVLKNAPPYQEIKERFKKIKIRYANATDLSSRVYEHGDLVGNFFKIMKVIDTETNAQQIRDIFDEFGFKYLTDQDLKSLQKRVGGINADNRIRLGFVDFFGYGKDFFTYLKGAKFEAILRSIAMITSMLDKEIILFTQEKINELVVKEITEKLLLTGKINSFSILVAPPYLFSRLASNFFENSTTHFLPNLSPPFSTRSKEESITKILEELLDSCAKVMSGDTSILKGSPEDIEYKIKIYKELFRDFKDIADARRAFFEDIKLIQPVLDKIESDIAQYISAERTVIIKDTSFLNKEDDVKGFMDTIADME
ncbi:hypothetical protein [Cronobacter dublinensis]|uniref:hypothetical protein n=1 Tax=Cronobacter dublinensis TaxID=413497 RepID=UPI00376FB38A